MVAITSEENWRPIVSNIYNTTEKINYLVNTYVESGAVTNLIENSLEVSERVKLITRHISPESIKFMVDQLTELTSRLNRAAYLTENNIEPVITDLRRTISNLRSFSEALKDRPSQTLFSKPPKQNE